MPSILELTRVLFIYKTGVVTVSNIWERNGTGSRVVYRYEQCQLSRTCNYWFTLAHTISVQKFDIKEDGVEFHVNAAVSWVMRFELWAAHHAANHTRLHRYVQDILQNLACFVNGIEKCIKVRKSRLSKLINERYDFSASNICDS